MKTDRKEIEKCNICGNNKWEVDDEPELGLYCTDCGLLGYRIEKGVRVVEGLSYEGLTYEDISGIRRIWKKKHDSGKITDNEYDNVAEAFGMLYKKLRWMRMGDNMKVFLIFCGIVGFILVVMLVSKIVRWMNNGQMFILWKRIEILWWCFRL